jgi:hypothetical protein
MALDAFGLVLLFPPGFAVRPVAAGIRIAVSTGARVAVSASVGVAVPTSVRIAVAAACAVPLPLLPATAPPPFAFPLPLDPLLPEVLGERGAPNCGAWSAARAGVGTFGRSNRWSSNQFNARRAEVARRPRADCRVAAAGCLRAQSLGANRR